MFQYNWVQKNCDIVSNNHIELFLSVGVMKFARNGSFGSKEHEEIVFEPEHEAMASVYYDKSLCIDWAMN